MCGVNGLILGDTRGTTAADDLYRSLSEFLQHRGQDAAGMTVCDRECMVYERKANGKASEVFDDGMSTHELPGYMGIGHVRDAAAGTSSESEAQPFYVDPPYGIYIGMDGSLVNTSYLREFLDIETTRRIDTDSDSELMLNVFAHALDRLGKSLADLSADNVFTALQDVYLRCQGAFVCTVMITGFGILGFRDANGIRPLCLGTRLCSPRRGVADFFLASESAAVTGCNFDNVVDILPGEAVLIQKGGAAHFRQVVERKSYTPDLFEFVYFAHSRSCIDGLSVHLSRASMGTKLGKTLKGTLGEKAVREIDIVFSTSETANVAAQMLARHFNVKGCAKALAKIAHVHRTVILPDQEAGENGVRRNVLKTDLDFRGKTVCLVDMSIVRANTSREMVRMVREAGAARIIVASCSPEVTHPHIYGIDLADQTELIAHNKTRQEIAEHLGADEVVFQSLDDLKAACLEAFMGQGKSKLRDFETGVFCGRYSSGVPEGYFEHLGRKQKTENTDAAAGAHAGTGPVTSPPSELFTPSGDDVDSTLTSGYDASALSSEDDDSSVVGSQSDFLCPNCRDEVEYWKLSLFQRVTNSIIADLDAAEEYLRDKDYLRRVIYPTLKAIGNGIIGLLVVVVPEE